MLAIIDSQPDRSEEYWNTAASSTTQPRWANSPTARKRSEYKHTVSKIGNLITFICNAECVCHHHHEHKADGHEDVGDGDHSLISRDGQCHWCGRVWHHNDGEEEDEERVCSRFQSCREVTQKSSVGFVYICVCVNFFYMLAGT